MRRTFASILFALDEKPTYVMAQMGHTTANLTLTIYAREMDRRDGEPERLRRLVEGGDLSEYVRGKDGGRQDSAIETGPHNAAEPVNSGKKGA